jgi:RNA-binding protein
VKLTAKQRQYLKGLAHGLEPIVRVGKAGATAAVVAKTLESLRAHELIKVRIDEENPGRAAIAEQLAQDANARATRTRRSPCRADARAGRSRFSGAS